MPSLMTISNNLLTGIYQPGQCFTFKQKITNFGLIFLQLQISPQASHYYFFPVRLDNQTTSLERFRYGEAFLTQFRDDTVPSGITEGFMCFSFYNRKSVKIMDAFLSPIGRLVIQTNYLNLTGITGTSTIDELARWLENWEHGFGRNGKLVNLQDVLE
jgi:hypothetical protein